MITHCRHTALSRTSWDLNQITDLFGKDLCKRFHSQNVNNNSIWFTNLIGELNK
jgi:hypothetical protein